MNFLSNIFKWATIASYEGVKHYLTGGMDWNRIDPQPMNPVWGTVYQGGRITPAGIRKIPGPVYVVNMASGLDDYDETKDANNVVGIYDIGLNDLNDCFTATDLIEHVEFGIRTLNAGTNLYVHCHDGVSRSTYYDIALHMRGMRIGYSDALEYIRKSRPCVSPNPWFIEQLTRMEKVLMTG